MATRGFALTRLETYGDDCHVVTWAGLLNGDDGTPIEMGGYGNRSIQFLGTFGAGGNILLEGSNNGAAWFTLYDPQGNLISKAAADLERIDVLARFMRPRVSAGDGTTNLSALMFLARRP